MKNFRAFSILVLAVSAVAMATGTFAQGRYGNVYSRGDVDGFIRNLEASSDAFSRDFRSTGGASVSERRTVDRFENAVDRLRSRFDSTNTWWQSRNDVRGMMDEARQVNVMMNNDRYARPLERQWRGLRRDINRLADTYELPELAGGGGGDGGGGWTPGGQTSTPPNWAQGTFYGIAPGTGAPIVLTIARNGRVTATVGNGMPTYGTYFRGMLTLGYNNARVNRISNGLQTVSTTDGETINYSRTYSGGGGGGWTPGDQTSTPPNWAQGTFYGIAPATGAPIVLTIARNGRVTATVGNEMPTYGTYFRGMLTLGYNSARVNRISNGLQTVSTTDGETINYSRTYSGGGGGGWIPGGNVPNWAVGSFIGRNPINGSTIFMTVERNGNVTVTMGGSQSYGTLRGNLLTMGSSTARVERDGNGFRTVSTTDGQTIFYQRN